MIVDREFIENNSSLTAEAILNEIKYGGELKMTKNVFNDGNIKIDARKLHRFDKDYFFGQILIAYQSFSYKSHGFDGEEIRLQRNNKFDIVDDEYNKNCQHSLKSNYFIYALTDSITKKITEYKDIINKVQYIPFRNLLSIAKENSSINIDEFDGKKQLGVILKDIETLKTIRFYDAFVHIAKDWLIKHNEKCFVYDGSIFKIKLPNKEYKKEEQICGVHCQEYRFSSSNCVKTITRTETTLLINDLLKERIGILDFPDFYDVEDLFDNLKHFIDSI